MTAFHLRVTGGVNWYGLWTLYLKEVRHFLKFPAYTVLAPTITGLLFLAIFTLALGGTVRQVVGMPFTEFLVPGLAIMAVVHASFDNPVGKVYLGPPPPAEDPLPYPAGPSKLNAVYYGGGTGGCRTYGDIMFKDNYWLEHGTPGFDPTIYLIALVELILADYSGKIYSAEGFFDVCLFKFSECRVRW